MRINHITIAAPSLTAASTPSPQISKQVSFEVDDPPVQVHPVSMVPARFSMRSSWISSSPPGKL